MEHHHATMLIGKPSISIRAIYTMAMLNNQSVILATSGQQAAPQSCDCGGTASGGDGGAGPTCSCHGSPQKKVRLMDISPYIMYI